MNTLNFDLTEPCFQPIRPERILALKKRGVKYRFNRNGIWAYQICPILDDQMADDEQGYFSVSHLKNLLEGKPFHLFTNEIDMPSVLGYDEPIHQDIVDDKIIWHIPTCYRSWSGGVGKLFFDKNTLQEELSLLKELILTKEQEEQLPLSFVHSEFNNDYAIKFHHYSDLSSYLDFKDKTSFQEQMKYHFGSTANKQFSFLVHVVNQNDLIQYSSPYSTSIPCMISHLLNIKDIDEPHRLTPVEIDFAIHVIKTLYNKGFHHAKPLIESMIERYYPENNAGLHEFLSIVFDRPFPFGDIRDILLKQEYSV